MWRVRVRDSFAARHSRSGILHIIESVILKSLFLLPGRSRLTESTVGDALPVLFEPSVGVEDGGVFSPYFGHPGENIVLIADNVASVWSQSRSAQLMSREKIELTS
jgi:hypothetical protein